mmetsp:Transcript_46393/g.52389  ORF Transcript_46393/g.52389 Transcript_46393/m.52389 type:complete len:170 (+) Transcript_46393:163-672(+)
MLDPIPLKVRDCLTELSSAQQVILRGYIGTLRADLKEKEGEILGLRDGDSNAHFHGDKMCTENHGHDSTEHGHDHGGDSTEHKHGHGHGHGHGDHKKSEGCDGHEHGHDDHKKSEGSDHGHDHNKHEHKHEHKPAEGHDHGHEHKHTDTKEKKTVEAGDPMALDWNTGN